MVNFEKASGVGEPYDEHGEELRALNEAWEFDPLVGCVEAAAADAEGVDGGEAGGLELIAIADSAGGGEGE